MIIQKRAKAILNDYKKSPSLLYLCDEYNDFVKNMVYSNITAEIEYILKKSYDDNEAPLRFEDLEDKKINSITQEMINERIKENGNKKVNRETIKEELLNEIEIYEYWLISENLSYLLEKEGEIVLNGCYWARQTTGQSVALDTCIMNAFINFLKNTCEVTE